MAMDVVVFAAPDVGVSTAESNEWAMQGRLD